MVREHRLHPSDLILPVFVLAGENRTEAVASMPGVERMTLDRLFPVAEQCLTLGVPCLSMASSLAYYDSYRSENLPQNLTQAQRDFFGAHTYGRTDADPSKKFHTQWSGDRSESPV